MSDLPADLLARHVEAQALIAYEHRRPSGAPRWEDAPLRIKRAWRRNVAAEAEAWARREWDDLRGVERRDVPVLGVALACDGLGERKSGAA